MFWSRRSLGQLLNGADCVRAHLSLVFAPLPNETRVCQNVLDRDATDLRGQQHTSHTPRTLVPQICVANVAGDMLS